jgi:hypothetical protein
MGPLWIAGEQVGGVCDLADLYASNDISPPDDMRALTWFYAVNTWATGPCLKHNGGCQYIARDPKNVRQRLESRMTPEEIAKARDDARDWLRTWESAHGCTPRQLTNAKCPRLTK